MTGRYERVEVITGVARRRRWSAEEKLRIVGDLSRPGASVSSVARDHEVNPSLLFKWRRLAREGAFGPLPDGRTAFVPIRLVTAEPPSSPVEVAPGSSAGEVASPMVEIALPNGWSAAGSGKHRGRCIAPAGDGAEDGGLMPVALAPDTKVYLALAPVDMRKGYDGLAALVHQVLKRDPFCGHLFLFRSKRADRLKLLWWDGSGLCLFASGWSGDDSSGRASRRGRSR